MPSETKCKDLMPLASVHSIAQCQTHCVDLFSLLLSTICIWLSQSKIIRWQNHFDRFFKAFAEIFFSVMLFGRIYGFWMWFYYPEYEHTFEFSFYLQMKSVPHKIIPIECAVHATAFTPMQNDIYHISFFFSSFLWIYSYVCVCFCAWIFEHIEAIRWCRRREFFLSSTFGLSSVDNEYNAILIQFPTVKLRRIFHTHTKSVSAFGAFLAAINRTDGLWQEREKPSQISLKYFFATFLFLKFKFSSVSPSLFHCLLEPHAFQPCICIHICLQLDAMNFHWLNLSSEIILNIYRDKSYNSGKKNDALFGSFCQY